MAVIIENIKLPNSCSDCPMCHPKGKDEPWNYCCFATMDDINIEEWDKERYITCPLKEVPTGKWIPVSEKLPNPYMFVNATCRSLVDDRDDWVVETIYLPIPKEHNPRHYSDWGNIPMLNWGEAEVIAWMERIIPKPYKMVEEQQGENTNEN